MKTLKFIQVNIYKGKYLEALVDFLKKEEPDFISMQEVTVNGFNFYWDKSVNLFNLLKNELKMNGVFNGDLELLGDESSVFGNALLTKYEIIGSHIEVLKKFRPVSLEELDGESGFEIRPKIDRHLLDAQVSFKGQNIHIMSWHGAWTAPPADTKETLRQAKIVADYLKSLNGPFILGGDLNNVVGSKTIGMVEDVANNLMQSANAVQTTHPKIHKIAPRGFLVDYIFASHHFTLKSIEVANVLVSDHLPVVAVLELEI